MLGMQAPTAPNKVSQNLGMETATSGLRTLTTEGSSSWLEFVSLSISIMRLASVVLLAYWALIFVGTHLGISLFSRNLRPKCRGNPVSALHCDAQWLTLKVPLQDPRQSTAHCGIGCVSKLARIFRYLELPVIQLHKLAVWSYPQR